ncbi:hypothetical protein SDC9_142708 [bioreactor metagenome]|uniref:Uncharacterized protein n=1 Tax=bioreactor metagenome TaxID=1076179 RepID=A0A645E420_9ZZZZ
MNVLMEDIPYNLHTMADITGMDNNLRAIISKKIKLLEMLIFYENIYRIRYKNYLRYRMKYITEINGSVWYQEEKSVCHQKRNY